MKVSLVLPKDCIITSTTSHQLTPQQPTLQLLTSQQVTQQQLASQQLTSQQLASQQLTPQQPTLQLLTSQQLASQQPTSQQLTSQQLTSQQLTSHQGTSQQLTLPTHCVAPISFASSTLGSSGGTTTSAVSVGDNKSSVENLLANFRKDSHSKRGHYWSCPICHEHKVSFKNKRHNQNHNHPS